MTADERKAAIESALRMLSLNAIVPASVKTGITALAEEVKHQGERLAAVERALKEKVT